MSLKRPRVGGPHLVNVHAKKSTKNERRERKKNSRQEEEKKILQKNWQREDVSNVWRFMFFFGEIGESLEES